MKVFIKKWKMMIIGIIGLLITLVLGIVSQQKTVEEMTTLRFLMFGEEPQGMEEVLEEFYQRTKDTLSIRIEMDWISISSDYKVESEMKLSTEEPYDLVFDAYWLHLSDMQERGVYADLSNYFSNPAYPGLYQAFSEKILENSKMDDKVYSIPILRTYGSGCPCIFYRKDLAEKYGIMTIETQEDMESYLEQILQREEGMIPLLLQGNRGFFTLNPQGYPMTSRQQRRIVYPIKIGGVSVVAQLNEAQTDVEAVAIMGDSEGFAGFMEGLQFDFLIENVDGYRAWRKYCEADSMNQTDQSQMFMSGRGSAYIGTLDDYEKLSATISQTIEDAKIGVYIMNERVRNFEEGAINTSLKANNFLCIPKKSVHIEETMRFLDWLFSNSENHDLFEYGIEGKHWRAVGDGLYETIADDKGELYIFPGYSLTWNQNYVRFPADMPKDVLKYKQYELLETTFCEKKLENFSFDKSRVQNQYTRSEHILAKAWKPISHGMMEEPRQTLQRAVEEAMEAGLREVLEELQWQLQIYLDETT